LNALDPDSNSIQEYVDIIPSVTVTDGTASPQPQLPPENWTLVLNRLPVSDLKNVTSLSADFRQLGRPLLHLENLENPKTILENLMGAQIQNLLATYHHV